MELWDPIGVAGDPAAADEYDSYLWRIYRELQAGSVDSLSSYLHFTATDTMGLERNRGDDHLAARALFDWWATNREP